MPSSNSKNSPKQKNYQTGKAFEKLALKYFKDQDYEILETNFRCGKKEIDLIVKNDNTLVFVEVKSARSKKFGHPSERVDKKKIENIAEVASQYLMEHNIDNLDIRFDVVTFYEGKLEHFENAFDLSE